MSAKKEPKKARKGIETKQDRQERFLEFFKANTCNVSKSCDSVGIGRTIFYEWLKEKDVNGVNIFAESIENAREALIDDAEAVLHKLVTIDEDPASVRYMLDRLAKKRGYTDKQEIEHSGGVDNNLTISFVGIEK